jgi:hypothetical protein
MRELIEDTVKYRKIPRPLVLFVVRERLSPKTAISK